MNDRQLPEPDRRRSSADGFAERLGEELRALPRPGARPGFTHRVLARLDAQAQEPRSHSPLSSFLGRPAAVAAALAALVAALAVTLLLPLGSDRVSTADRAASTDAAPLADAVTLAEAAPLADGAAQVVPSGLDRSRLEAERQQLRAELAALRQQLDAPPTLIYLGGDDQVDVVLDLAQLARRRPDLEGGNRPAVMPR